MEFNVALNGCKRVVIRMEVDGDQVFESLPVLVPEGYEAGINVRIKKAERLETAAIATD